MPQMRKRLKQFLQTVCILAPLVLPTHAFAFLFSASKTIWPEITEHYALPGSTRHLAVRQQLTFFLDHPGTIEALTKNACPYIYYIYRQTRLRHMPAEIALLPMIESNYKPFTFSHAGAVGLWQLMPGTASGYGIKMNWWYDGRRNTIKATNVSLNYLLYLHDMFNKNWLLAIAAYDAGEGTVLNAIRYNQEHNRPTDFWDLPLPRETRHYVPRLLALANIIDHPSYYHVNLSPVPNGPINTTAIIKKQMNLSSIAKDAGITVQTVRNLNPGFRRFATPPDQATTLILPIKHIAPFIRNTNTKHHKTDIQWLHYFVKPGDTLSGIAYKFKTSVNALKQVNTLKHHVLRIKQELLIPRAHKHAAASSRQIVSLNTINEDHIPGPKRSVHIAKHGESFWSIAKQHHIKISQIRFWNNLSIHSLIHEGQKLVIWEKQRKTRNPTYATYKVKSGDNISMIAERHKTTTHQIKRLNGLKTTVLQIGQTLRLPRH